MERIFATITKEREVRPDATLWKGSEILFDKVNLDRKGSYYLYMASIIFSTFSMEAYLNHIGKLIFEEDKWNKYRWYRPLDKLDDVCRHFNISLDKSKRPYQTIKSIFDFRNDLAHGDTKKLGPEARTCVINEHSDKKLVEPLKTLWQKYPSKDNAKRARNDVEKIALEIHKYSGLENSYPFISGLHSATLKLINLDPRKT